MKLSEALDLVSARYVPGTVKYYAALSPDPWQAAHDELEKIAGVFEEGAVDAATECFVTRCHELTERFKREGQASKSVAPSDAFAMGGPRQVQAHISRKHKRCAQCDSKENLRIVELHAGSMDVVILCANHAERRGA